MCVWIMRRRGDGDIAALALTSFVARSGGFGRWSTGRVCARQDGKAKRQNKRQVNSSLTLRVWLGRRCIFCWGRRLNFAGRSRCSGGGGFAASHDAECVGIDSDEVVGAVQGWQSQKRETREKIKVKC